ncbi:MAG TPA: permease prefix domain 1-containing protein [Pyrinomonadaceae bacterium]|nr:permease prefix domain 1-containing protein [Pyrinomonadaceae bacterium]
MIPKRLLKLDASSIRREVEEELQFHIDMSAREYESRGFSADQARDLAKRRLGNISAIKRECLQISVRKRLQVKLKSILCSIIFALGIVIKVASTDVDVAQMGTVLIIIALSGGLLTFVKILSVLHLVSDRKPINLGLNTDKQSG